VHSTIVAPLSRRSGSAVSSAWHLSAPPAIRAGRSPPADRLAGSSTAPA